MFRGLFRSFTDTSNVLRRSLMMDSAEGLAAGKKAAAIAAVNEFVKASL